MAPPVQNQKPGQKPPAPAAPAAAKPAAAATRKGKPTQWRRWAEQAIRFANLAANLKRLAAVPAPAADVVRFKNLSECIPGDEALEEVATLVSSLHRLDADQVKVPRVPPAPRFALGDKVKIVKKFCLPRYTAFASEAQLQALVILDVAADGRQFLCETEPDGGIQIHVAAPRHLEKR